MTRILPGTLVAYARQELLDALRHAVSSVFLVSPFLSWPVANELVEAVNQSGASKRQLLTALDELSVRAGVLDPRALRVLHQSGFDIATRRNLHAKVTLVDASWGLIGSGNLTNAGLGSDDDGHARANIELGVILDEDQRLEARRMVNEWWTGARIVSGKEIAAYERMPRFSRSAREVVDGGPPVEPVVNAWIEQVMAESQAVAMARRYWVKAAYHTTGQDPDLWWDRGWISDWRDPRYREGDLIVLYLGRSHSCCPAILNVVDKPREDAAFVEANGRGPGDRKWPWVTGTKCVFEMPIDRAPPPTVFDISPRSLQNGYRGITREQFECAVRAMVAR